MRTLAFILFLVTALGCQAQRLKPVQEELPSENLEMKKDSNKRSTRPRRKNILLLYVPTADNILYGNPCVLEETHKMGFEYIVEPIQLAGSKTWAGKRLNNLLVKTKLVITRSPFWKLILRKKIKKCRELSGDLVG